MSQRAAQNWSLGLGRTNEMIGSHDIARYHKINSIILYFRAVLLCFAFEMNKKLRLTSPELVDRALKDVILTCFFFC